ncbi:MAG: N-acetyltransferase family protein [Promethearchaeota archaeon]|jgi:RimJ/RimL family protein N-acetyltransferase
MQVSIKRADITDAESISLIWGIICSERIYSAINKPFTPQQEREYISSLSEREGIFLAEIENQVIGFQSLDLWAKFTDSFDHVGTIGTFLLPGWRGNHIGRQLADYTFRFARENGYEKLVIYVRARNNRAINFYKNLGFTRKGILTDQVRIDGNYEDEIFMEMFL